MTNKKCVFVLIKSPKPYCFTSFYQGHSQMTTIARKEKKEINLFYGVRIKFFHSL